MEQQIRQFKEVGNEIKRELRIQTAHSNSSNGQNL